MSTFWANTFCLDSLYWLYPNFDMGLSLGLDCGDETEENILTSSRFEELPGPPSAAWSRNPAGDMLELG